MSQARLAPPGLPMRRPDIVADPRIVKRTNYTDDYETVDGAPLGRGVNGAVFRMKHRQTGQMVAVKKILSTHKAVREINLHYLAQKGCHYVTKIHDLYINELPCNVKHADGTIRTGVQWFILIMMEICEGGELFGFISARVDRKKQTGAARETSIFTEREVAAMMRQICKAVFHLHTVLKIAHRDLKPENLLLTSAYDPLTHGLLKLSDFGFAKDAFDMYSRKALQTPCYTPYYVAPEVISNCNYDYACDIWSLGVMLYIMLVGYPPFYSHTGQNILTPTMKDTIREADFSFDKPEFSLISKSAKGLIEQMLTVDPSRRIKIAEIMQHPWINQAIDQVPDTPLPLNQEQFDLFSIGSVRERFNTEMEKNLVPQRGPVETMELEKFSVAERLSMPSSSSIARKRQRGRGIKLPVEPAVGLQSPPAKTVKDSFIDQLH